LWDDLLDLDMHTGSVIAGNVGSQEIYIALTKELNSKANLSGEIILKGRYSPTKVYSI